MHFWRYNKECRFERVNRLLQRLGVGSRVYSWFYKIMVAKERLFNSSIVFR